MSPWLDGKLVTLILTEDNHVALTLTADEKLAFFTRYLHGVQRFMRFKCVSDALSEFVPHLKRAIKT